jgi:hypothetical protein
MSTASTRHRAPDTSDAPQHDCIGVAQSPGITKATNQLAEDKRLVNIHLIVDIHVR